MNSANICCKVIKDLMLGKKCHFSLETVDHTTVEKMLRGLSVDPSSGFDNPDGRIIKAAVDMLVVPICHIF